MKDTRSTENINVIRKLYRNEQESITSKVYNYFLLHTVKILLNCRPNLTFILLFYEN